PAPHRRRVRQGAERLVLDLLLRVRRRQRALHQGGHEGLVRQGARHRARHLRQVRLDAHRGHPLVGRAFAGADPRGPDARFRAAYLQVRAALRARHADVQGHLRRQGRGGREHAGRRPGAVMARVVLAVALLALVPSVARAQATWLRDRLDVEWVVATGGWRAAVSSTDARAPGFDALAGGGEFVLGLDVGAGLAVVGDGRVLAGEAGGAEHTYFEALGGLALQLRVGRARLRAGPAAGWTKLRGDQA